MEIRRLTAAEVVLTAWFDSLLTQGFGIRDALNEIVLAYPDGEWPLGSDFAWHAFAKRQLS